MADFSISGILSMRDEMSGTMAKVRSSMGILGQQLGELGGGFETVGNVMQGFAAGGPAGAATAAIGEIIQATQACIQTFTEFETALVNTSSASGFAGEALATLQDELTEAARAAGVEFGVGATKAMEALESLVKAGLEGADAVTALEAALALAKVEGIATAEASDLLVGVMGMFKLSAEQAAMATDILVNASIKGIGTASEFARGLAYVGGRADQLGFSLEETTAALVAMNNQGINATSAGQYLNQMFSSLIEKSDELGFSLYDSEGNMLSLAEISGNLTEKVNSLATAEEKNAYLTQMFGARAGIAANALIKLGGSGEEVTAALLEMTDGLNETGTAMDIVDQKQDTLAGTQERLNATFEDMQLTIGEALAPIMEYFAEFVETTLIPILEDVLPPVVAFIGAIFELIKFIADLVTVISTALKPTFEGLIKFFKPLIDGIMWIANGIAALTGAVVAGVGEMADSIEEAADEITESTEEMTDTLIDEGQEYRDMVAENRRQARLMALGITEANEEIAESYEEMTDDIGDSLEDIAEDTEMTWDQIVAATTGAIKDGLVGEAQDLIHDFVNCSTNKQADMVDEIDGYLEDLNESYTANRAKIRDLQERGLHAEAAMLIKKNEEIHMKIRQLNAWRNQLISGSWEETTAIIQSALEEQERMLTASAITMEDVTENLANVLSDSMDIDPINLTRDLGDLSPIRQNPVMPIDAQITMEFPNEITEFDAREHAQAILDELKALQEEEDIARFG